MINTLIYFISSGDLPKTGVNTRVRTERKAWWESAATNLLYNVQLNDIGD